jgi:hypothetical protein
VSIGATEVPNPGSYGAWSGHRNIVLNTSATGANVAGTVTNFPVLVRLGAAEGGIIAAANGGNSIRFSKADNTTALPYQIESWSSTAAAIWVRVDSVKGNNATGALGHLLCYRSCAEPLDARPGVGAQDNEIESSGVCMQEDYACRVAVLLGDAQPYASGVSRSPQRFGLGDSLACSPVESLAHWNGVHGCQLRVARATERECVLEGGLCRPREVDGTEDARGYGHCVLLQEDGRRVARSSQNAARDGRALSTTAIERRPCIPMSAFRVAHSV